MANEPELYRRLKRLNWNQKANLALSLMLSKGLITEDDLRAALLPVLTCNLCDDFATPPCETTEQSERLMMDHMRYHHPEHVGRTSQFFVNRGEAQSLEEGL
jgi:hypothetical protein